MRRRDFLALAGASAATWPLSARAQQPSVPLAGGGRPWLIGAMVGTSVAQGDIDLRPFRKGMSDLGYAEGGDYIIEARYTDGDARRFPALAKELVDLAPDVVIAGNGAAAAAVKQFTTNIPILAQTLNSADLDALIGASLAHPVGNVTGIFNDLSRLLGKHCELALEVVPGAKSIGVLLYSHSTDAASARPLVTAAAERRNFTPVFVDVDTFDDLAPAYALLRQRHVDVAVVGASSLLAADRPRTVAAAANVKLPSVYNAQEYAEAGGLISYGFDRRAGWERIATYAHRTLAGAMPADLPVEQALNYLMAINLKTARTFGLTIPPSVLFRADEVIGA